MQRWQYPFHNGTINLFNNMEDVDQTRLLREPLIVGELHLCIERYSLFKQTFTCTLKRL